MIDFKIVCHPSKKRKDGTVAVLIKATKGSKSIQLKTNIYILPTQWRDSRVVDHPNAQRLNTELTRQLYAIQSWALDLLRKNKNVQLSALYSYQSTPRSLVKFIRTNLETDRLLAKATKKRYRVMCAHVERLDKDVTIDMVDMKWMENFDHYLIDLELNPNTRKSIFTALERFLNIAGSLEIIDSRSVPKYSTKIKNIKSDRCSLTSKELERMEAVELIGDAAHLDKVRDMFLLSCYTGLRYQDIQALTPYSFREGNEGLELHIRAKKTGKLLTIPLEIIFDAKPAVLVRKYLSQIKATNEMNIPIFAQITNQYANRSLKEIAFRSKIIKRVTMHVGRHTFATYLAPKIPTKLLQELLQHSKIETTMIYVHMSNKDIVEELKKVFK